jgi:hypothetical protein
MSAGISSREKELQEKQWTLEARLRMTTHPKSKEKIRKQVRELQEQISLTKKISRSIHSSSTGIESEKTARSLTRKVIA